MNKLSIAMTTIGRSEMLAKSLSNWRVLLPDVKIYVLDQNGDERNKKIYELLRIDVIYAEFDIGLSSARNILVNNIKEEFALFVDDDDMLDKGSNSGLLYELLSLFEINPKLLILGATPKDRIWAPFYRYDDKNKTLYQVDACDEPILMYTKNKLMVKEVDVVVNFMIINIILMKMHSVRWDDDLKMSEHTPFFFDLWKRRAKGLDVMVGISSDFLMHSIPGDRRPVDYTMLRNRKTFINHGSRKYGYDFKVHESNSFSSSSVYDINWMSRDLYWSERLRKFCEVLEKLGAQWWLANGSLLGLMREGNFIIHDQDMDVGIMEGSVKFSELVEAMSKEGFKIINIYGRPGNGLEIAFGSQSPIFGVWPFRNPKIDLFFHKPINIEGLKKVKSAVYKYGLRRWLSFSVSETDWYFSESWQYPVRIPVNYEQVLIEQYGENWKIADTKWCWWTSPRNIILGKDEKIGLADYWFKLKVKGFYNSLKSSVKRWVAKLSRIQKSLK